MAKHGILGKQIAEIDYHMEIHNWCLLMDGEMVNSMVLAESYSRMKVRTADIKKSREKLGSISAPHPLAVQFLCK